MVFWHFEFLYFPLFASVVHIRTPFLQSLEVGFSFTCIVLLHGWFCMARLFYIRLQGVVGHVCFRRGKLAARGLEL